VGLAHVLYPAPAQDGMEQWLLNNYAHHRAINAGASGRGLNIGSYLIYPVRQENMRDFLEQHQRWHTDMCTALGITGNDLSDVDFNNDQQKDAWMFLHYQEHLAAATKLGRGI